MTKSLPVLPFAGTLLVVPTSTRKVFFGGKTHSSKNKLLKQMSPKTKLQLLVCVFDIEWLVNNSIFWFNNGNLFYFA